MKIRKIHIKGYKVFDDIELDFTDKEGNTLDTVVLAGVNGSGKTTLLELISQLFSVNTNPQKTIYVTEQDYRHKYIAFIEDILIEIEINQDFQSKALKAIPILTEKKLIPEEKIESIKQQIEGSLIIKLSHSFDTKIDTNTAIVKNISSSFNAFNFLHTQIVIAKIYYIPTNNYINELAKNSNQENLENITTSINNTLRTVIHKIDFRKHKKWVEGFIVENAMQEILNNRDKTPEITIQKLTSEINQIFKNLNFKTKLVDITATEPIFESFNGEKISINDLSSGEKQLFYRAVYLRNLNINNSIILVDEVEASLHPTWQQEILKLYQNIGENNQVIVTTHSPHVISSVKPESLFVLYPNEETQKIEAINMAKQDKQSKGLEPNRVLREIMGTPLRDYETQSKIDQVATSLREKNYEKPEIQALMEELKIDLGRQDPFIMRMNHQIMMFERQKSKMTN